MQHLLDILAVAFQSMAQKAAMLHAPGARSRKELRGALLKAVVVGRLGYQAFCRQQNIFEHVRQDKVLAQKILEESSEQGQAGVRVVCVGFVQLSCFDGQQKLLPDCSLTLLLCRILLGLGNTKVVERKRANVGRPVGPKKVPRRRPLQEQVKDEPGVEAIGQGSPCLSAHRPRGAGPPCVLRQALDKSFVVSPVGKPRAPGWNHFEKDQAESRVQVFCQIKVHGRVQSRVGQEKSMFLPFPFDASCWAQTFEPPS